MSDLFCTVCHHHCCLKEGQTGFCRARKNINGEIRCINYGKLTTLAIDPIEKKPLAFFHPGAQILSVGSFGCNLACPFCQNHTISMVKEEESRYAFFSPEQLLSIALQHPESIGIAFTYNEPLIGYEYVYDCAKLFQKHGLKTVLVTNGCVSLSVMEKLIPYIDAMNIDLKGDAAFYQELSGDEHTVKNTIQYVYDKCHLEVTTLVVPGKNDNDEWIRGSARWLSSLSPEIVLHLSRYFPHYRSKTPPTPIVSLQRLKAIAEEHLHTVLLGNVF